MACVCMGRSPKCSYNMSIYSYIMYSYAWEQIPIAIAIGISSKTRLKVDKLGQSGHFFGESSGSHLKTKLFGCDPDIKCSLENMLCWHLLNE